MFPVKTYASAALVGALCLAIQPAAMAAAPGAAVSLYKDMCVRAADMPQPHGESDLKGNPKLESYCGCYAPLFAEHAMVAMANRQEHPGQPPKALAESQAEQLAMRNTCRKQIGLPAAIAPSHPAPGAAKASH